MEWMDRVRSTPAAVTITNSPPIELASHLTHNIRGSLGRRLAHRRLNLSMAALLDSRKLFSHQLIALSISCQILTILLPPD